MVNCVHSNERNPETGEVMVLKNWMDLVFRSRTRRTIAFILAIIVTFTTTYSLVLPAITLSRDSAESMAGIDLGSSSQVGNTSSSQDAADSGEESDTESDLGTSNASASDGEIGRAHV